MDGHFFRKFGLALALCFLCPFQALGAEDSEVMGYDAIVNQLNREAAPTTQSSRSKNQAKAFSDPFDSIWIHGGAGFTSCMEDLVFPNGDHYLMNQKGIQAALGIDLFSENIMAEGTARSFGEGEDATKVSLQEFELKVFYKNRLAPQISAKFGAGLGARYLSVHEAAQATTTYTTPSSVITAGLDIYLNEHLSFGGEISYRNSMIADTMDHSSYDATLRMDTHF